MCFGTAGLDPSLGGLTDEGLQLLMSGIDSTGSPGSGGQEGRVSASPQSPPNAAAFPTFSAGGGFDVNGNAAGNGGALVSIEQEVARGVQGGMPSGENRALMYGGNDSAPVAVNGGGGSAGAGGSGEGADMGEFDADSVGGGPEVRARCRPFFVFHPMVGRYGLCGLLEW